VRLSPRLPRAWVVGGVLLAIVAAAIVLRFADLAANPGGLYGDEAAEGLDAARLLREPGYHADFGVWFTSDAGREALFAYVAAAVFNFAGISILALRATAAAFGVAGVLGIWLLARRFGTWTGLAAAAWAAGSLWLVCVSRDGMRNTIVPLFSALALLALLTWVARPSRWTAAVAGAVVALAALYTYQPLKLLPVLAIAWLWWLRRVDRPTYERLRRGFVAAGVAFLVVAAPMMAVAVTNPANYFGRAVGVSPFNPEVDTGAGVAEHLLRTAGMFGFTGDPNARHDVAGLPLLSLPLAALALLGLVRLWRMRRQPAGALVLWALPIFLLPPLVAVEGGSPHFLRALGLAAPLGVTIGLGAAELVEQVRQRGGPRAGGEAIALVILLLVATAAGSGLAYLTRPVDDRFEPFGYQQVQLATAAQEPGSAVIVDEWSVTVVRFVDFDSPPALFTRGERIADPAAYSRVFAADRADLGKALDQSAVDRATAVAWDPDGKPTVWAVEP
jgi:4-amino-4-deoxy-L-arabinose transferase-like glycosyltransferase